MRYGKTDPFYLSSDWRRLRKKVLAKHKCECQLCKAKGKYTKATHVHHEFHRDKYPQYELYEYAEQNGKRIKNLIPVCFECHMEIHIS
jgi:5-methylcytosine-specific restriction protein A